MPKQTFLCSFDKKTFAFFMPVITHRLTIHLILHWLSILYILAQGPGKQSLSSIPSPKQWSPNLSGIGLEQFLWRRWIPTSHVTEQVSHWPHVLQPPWTKKGIRLVDWICQCLIYFQLSVYHVKLICSCPFLKQEKDLGKRAIVKAIRKPWRKKIFIFNYYLTHSFLVFFSQVLILEIWRKSLSCPKKTIQWSFENILVLIWILKVQQLVPGQSGLLQILNSSSFPVQFKPPLEGAGFVHDLFLNWVPFSHVTSHADHCDHSAQFPSTLRLYTCKSY